MASSMLLASRVACSFSSCEVTSLARSSDAPMVRGRCDRKSDFCALRLLPYLLGFRAGIASVYRGQVCLHESQYDH